MRTTLKRRIGSWGPAAGNGGRSAPPKMARGPSFYEQPRSSGRIFRGLGRFLVNATLTVAVLGGGFIGGLALWGKTEINKTKATDTDIKKTKQYIDAPVPDQPVIALVVGYDHRRGMGGDPGRSDTLMLVRIDPRGGKESVAMLSFPRDLRVPLYCNKSYPFETNKINAAYNRCGAPGPLLTIKALTGIPINYVIKVNFRGFKQIVDKMGGIWIDVDHRYYNHNVHTIATDYADIDLQPGYQRLYGAPALDFARFRHTDSDLIRNIRQQAVVRALRDQLSRQSLFDYPKLIDAIASNTQIEPSIGLNTMRGYAELANRLPGGHFLQVKIDNVTNAGGGSSDLVASQTSIDKAVEQFLDPDLTASARAAKQNRIASASSNKGAAPPPEKTTVLVLNGGNTEGLARDTSAGLVNRGYKVVYPAGGALANFPGDTLWDSKVFYDPDQAKAQLAADEVSKLFDAAVVKPMIPSVARMANGAMVVAALGQTFDGTLPPIPPKVEVPEPQAPQVTVNPGLTSSQLAAIQRKIRFRLEVPSRIASSSSLSSLSPIRVYNIFERRKAVRLTFWIRGYPAGYWGIEETSWGDAPVLSDPDFTRTIGGREYDFYYQDAHLHMVVLRDNGATYWVVNTLDNMLSNETMIAIAKGFRPTKGRVRR
jgi:LCP family protein required for cell wall assembly